MSRRTAHDFRDRGRDAPFLRGMIRRLVVKLTQATGLWQLLGFEDADGNEELLNDVETFPGIGFSSRPKAGSRAEVVVVRIGGESGHPVIVATRDRSIEISLEEDETAIFNSTGTVVKITKDGIVELGGVGLFPTDGVVHGTGVDPFTGVQYFNLGSTSAIVRAKK